MARSVPLLDESDARNDPVTPPNETPSLDPLSPLDPISPWPPLPPPSSPRSPISPGTSTTSSSQEILPNPTDVYASIAILGTYLLFGLYLFWALGPEDWVGWLPDRHWSLIVPCWLMMVVLLTYWSYAALVIYLTPSFDSPICMTDPYSNIPAVSSIHNDQSEPYYWKYAGQEAIPEACDLPVDLVGRVLYPARRGVRAKHND
ncbi:hypothetical protein IAR55_005740 [Kwoniella newhampshirensis]|uniref:PIG-P domain-containing protein n=1 Tax=Kwoniella newhampshirensis TaxID=1651941 RepID=A0AAW0YVE4_9TREE